MLNDAARSLYLKHIAGMIEVNLQALKFTHYVRQSALHLTEADGERAEECWGNESVKSLRGFIEHPTMLGRSDDTQP